MWRVALLTSWISCFFLVSCVRVSMTVLKFWQYDDRYLIIAINRSRLCLSCGAGILGIALVFPGSALILFCVEMCPTTFISFLLNLNFDRLNLMSFIWALSISAIKFLSCSASASLYVLPHLYTKKVVCCGCNTGASSSSSAFMSHIWNSLGALLIPNGSLHQW